MPKNKTCPEKWNRDNKINLLHSDYKILSDGGLTVPSSSLADFTCVCLAVLDFAETEFGKKNDYKRSSNICLTLDSLKGNFTYEEHLDWENKLSIKAIVNMIFNKKQKWEMTL